MAEIANLKSEQGTEGYPDKLFVLFVRNVVRNMTMHLTESQHCFGFLTNAWIQVALAT